MTHEEVTEQVKLEADSRLRKISWFQNKWLSFDNKDRRFIIAQILSIPEILIKDPDQSLPECPYKALSTFEPLLEIKRQIALINAYHQGQKDMLKENWKKVLPKE